MFFVPGIDETLRVLGRPPSYPKTVKIDLTEFGRAPLSVLVLQVERAYPQCSKAVVQSALWDRSGRWSGRVPAVLPGAADHCQAKTIPDEATLRAGLALEL